MIVMPNISPSCNMYGVIEDPTLENKAADDNIVFLMTVGDSSPVSRCRIPSEARTPNLPISTRVRVML